MQFVKNEITNIISNHYASLFFGTFPSVACIRPFQTQRVVVPARICQPSSLLSRQQLARLYERRGVYNSQEQTETFNNGSLNS